MSGRLILLNLALAAVAIYAGMKARDNWLEARKRADVVLGQKLKTAPAPPFTPLIAPERVQAAPYAEVAQQTLFSPDRNPTVIVEVAPPKPMPALPLVHGVLDLGDGAIAIMSVKKGEGQRPFRAGEAIGEFKLVAIKNRELVLEWDGKQITKKIEELIDRSEPAPASGEAPSARAAVPQAPPPPKATSASPTGPATEDLGAGVRACQRGDTSPPGTIVDGLKKVVSPSPFGQICRWEPVQ